MKISFGNTYVISENGIRTRNQFYVDNIVEDAFGIAPDWMSENEIERKNTENLLLDKKIADVFVKNKKDGSIDVEVRKLSGYPDFNEDPFEEGYIPYDAKGKRKLKINLDCNQTLTKLRKKIDAFEKKCREYALAADSEKNNKKELECMRNLEKKLEIKEIM